MMSLQMSPLKIIMLACVLLLPLDALPPSQWISVTSGRLSNSKPLKNQNSNLTMPGTLLKMMELIVPRQALAAGPETSGQAERLTADPYRVKAGDTPESIAEKYGISVRQLLGLNGLRTVEEIAPGKTIKVTVAAGADVTRGPAVAPARPAVNLPGVGLSGDPALKLPGVPGGPSLPGNMQTPGVSTGAMPAVPATRTPKAAAAPSPTVRQQPTPSVPALQGEPKDNASGDTASSLVVSGKDKTKGTTPQDKGLPQDENIQLFKEIVDDAAWQKVTPGKRQFVQLSRYFVNQISCPGGKFVQALMPQDKFIETEISDSGADLFLRVGNNPDKQFPLDLALICEDQTFMLNAVVHTGVPSQQIVLLLPKKTREKSSLTKFQDHITKAEALPMEEQLLRIAKRVYQENYLSFWEEDASIVSRHKWYKRPFSIVVNNVVRTHVNGFVAWDFLVKGYSDGSDDELFQELVKAVKGKPVAVGKVAGPSVARLIVITQEPGDPSAAARVKGMKP